MNNNILSFKENISKIKDLKSFYIKKISLKNFRNHKSLNLNLKNSSILIYGGNGSGKTNILEAISLLNQGTGLRKANIDLIDWKQFNKLEYIKATGGETFYTKEFWYFLESRNQIDIKLSFVRIDIN